MKTKEEILHEFKTKYYKYSLSRALFVFGMSCIVLMPLSLPLMFIVLITCLFLNKPVYLKLREVSDGEFFLLLFVLMMGYMFSGMFYREAFDGLVDKFFKKNPDYANIVNYYDLKEFVEKSTTQKNPKM